MQRDWNFQAQVRQTLPLFDLNAPPDLEEGEIPPFLSPCDLSLNLSSSNLSVQQVPIQALPGYHSYRVSEPGQHGIHPSQTGTLADPLPLAVANPPAHPLANPHANPPIQEPVNPPSIHPFNLTQTHCNPPHSAPIPVTASLPSYHLDQSLNHYQPLFSGAMHVYSQPDSYLPPQAPLNLALSNASLLLLPDAHIPAEQSRGVRNNISLQVSPARAVGKAKALLAVCLLN